MKEFINSMMEWTASTKSIEGIITIVGWIGALIVLLCLIKSAWTKKFLANGLCASGLALALPFATMNLINERNILFIVVFTGILIPLLVSIRRINQKN